MALSYSAKQTLTISLASIATSSTFIAGAESTQVDNTSSLYEDVILRGKVRCGTTPTANTQINIYVYGGADSLATTAIDVLDGTDSTESITSAGVLTGAVKLAGVLTVDTTTSDRDYFLAPVNIAQLFGGVVPPFWGIYVAHNTGVNLNSTGGNHVFEWIGVKW